MNIKNIIILSFSLLFVGCATKDLVAPHKDDVSLVFGYIDMQDAPSKKIDHARIKSVQPNLPGEKMVYSVDNVLFTPFLRPGKYKFTRLTSYHLGGNSGTDYDLGYQGRSEMDPVIKKPGVYYFGSYKYVSGDDGFTFERIEKPDEKSLLLKIKPYAKHDYWIKMINTRLDELK